MLIRMKEPDYLSGDWQLSYVVQHILSCQMLSVRVSFMLRLDAGAEKIAHLV